MKEYMKEHCDKLLKQKAEQIQINCQILTAQSGWDKDKLTDKKTKKIGKLIITPADIEIQSGRFDDYSRILVYQNEYEKIYLEIKKCKSCWDKWRYGIKSK